MNEFSKYITSNLTSSDSVPNGLYKLYDANNEIGMINKNNVKEEYITIIKDGSGVGKVRRLPKNTAFIGTMGGILSNNSDIDFVYYSLFNTDFTKEINGATIPHVYYSNYGNNEYYIPNISEQKEIGKLLTNIDNLITLHQRKYDNLVNVKKSLLEKMFPKNSSNIPEIRFKGFTDAWEQRKLEDITQIVMGQSPDSINYTDNSDDTVLIQGNADLNNGIVVPRIWSSQITKKSYPNDIIFTVRAPVGEIARNPYFATIGRGVASFKGNDFLYQSLIQKKENNYWNNISAGSTFDSINSDQLKNVIIYLPKNNLEQEKIGELFTNLDNLITLHQHKELKRRKDKNGHLRW